MSGRRDRVPGPVMRLRWYEEALALASYLEGQGFEEEGAQLREFAAKVRPAEETGRWAGRARAS